MSSLCGENAAAAVVAFAAALRKQSSDAELAALAAAFTMLGDTLAMLLASPCQPSCNSSSNTFTE